VKGKRLPSLAALAAAAELSQVTVIWYATAGRKQPHKRESREMSTAA
jgi:hypothetical protein